MIAFNKPYMTGKELFYISQAHHNMMLAGDGPFTKKCHQWLEKYTNKALLTHSCTAALEMAAILSDIRPKDEVIMPSYTFVSTANAFVLRGGVPVFVDVRSDTLNINESLIENAITDRTKAIVPVHYAGVSCAMDNIMDIARKHGLLVIEDAAQAVMSAYKGKPLGSIGDFGTFSFHETKNIISGEGGALLCNNEDYSERAEIIREKGTNRNQFFSGKVDKYTWVDIGSSYLPGEITAAFLWAQIEESEYITRQRLKLWNRYHRVFEGLEHAGVVRRPIVPNECSHNAHMYYLLLKDLDTRTKFISQMKRLGIHCVFHYVPLHLSPAGMRYGREASEFPVTCDIASRIVRLPLWVGLGSDQDKVISAVFKVLRTIDDRVSSLSLHACTDLEQEKSV